MNDPEIYTPGDVIRHADGHPAVVLEVDGEGWPVVVLVAFGDQARQQVCPPLMFDRVTSSIEADRAVKIAREEWAAGNRWGTSRKADR